ncbi:MAG: PD-(D/E)XK nuclease family protein [Bacteroidales bacterium]|nr:PD-(D/E)XK nuclease family protein [Bacteroidales bacterium]
MKGFLYSIAEKFISEYGDGIKDFCFVFPNRRASLFFRKYLGQNSPRPIFSPLLTTISDLFSSLSDLDKGDSIELQYILYKEYSALCPSCGMTAESFDEFVDWGETILSDFNDVDRYMVDADALFANVEDLKNLDTDYTFLSDNQRQVVEDFWRVVLSQTESFENKKVFRSTWKLLRQLYANYKRVLRKKGIAYEGMIFRDVAEKIQKESDSVTARLRPFKGIVFIGLNALSPSEKVLCDHVRNRFEGDFYWDFNGDMITDVNNKSSRFISENVKRYPSRLTVDTSVDYLPEIEVFSVPSSTGQAKVAASCLNPASADETAIILPDGKLLMPLLNSIPSDIDRINVTMGYSLSNSALSSLMGMLSSLQLNKRRSEEGFNFYHKDVLAILTHPFIIDAAKEEAASIKNDIIQSNRIRYAYDGENELLKTVFSGVENCNEACDWQLSIIDLLAAFIPPLEKEFAYGYYKAIVRIRDLKIPMEPKTYFKFLRQITSKLNVPFVGEPLQGLQIMGPLEMRALDFENVIILSVNEGIYPAKVHGHSFIPYNLRFGYGLPTIEDLDAISTYHFYRSLYRARKVTLLYDSRTTGLNVGEESRFIKQLKYHYRLPLKEKVCTYEVMPSPCKNDTLVKNDDVLTQIRERFLVDGKPFSASSINDYLNCQAEFYYKHIVGIRDEDTVSDDVEANEFGTIFHQTMEKIYKEFEGKVVTADLLDGLMKNETRIGAMIESELRRVKNLRNAPVAGKLLITVRVVQKLVLQTLKNDKAIAPFTYIRGEEKYYNDLEVELPTGPEKVKFIGVIDRLDLHEGTLRICDYKTGYVNDNELNLRAGLAKAFDPTDSSRPEILLQTVLYSWLVKNSGSSYRNYDKRVMIYKLKSAFNSQPLSLDVPDDIYEELEEGLKQLIAELFNPELPFSYSPEQRRCQFCPAFEICPKKINSND